MKLLYFIVLTGLCMACHQPRVYRINGSLPGALDGYVVKLYNPIHIPLFRERRRI